MTTPAQARNNAINSNRMTKAWKLARVLAKEAPTSVWVFPQETAQYLATHALGFKVARQANVNLNHPISHLTWRWAVGIARRLVK